MKNRVTLLGVPIDAITASEALTMLMGFLQRTGQHHVMTPNNEMLVEAAKNHAFAEVLKKSALNLPDSRGLQIMARWTGHVIPERVTGVDTVSALCASLDESHPVFLLGAAPGVAEQAAKTLRSRNPHFTVAGTYAGSPRREEAHDLIARINASQAHLLLVAFGAPAQDLWIAEHLHRMPTVRVAMGVGGTFDFLAGVKKRAPVFLRKIGLEWAWRFAQEPSRWRRMWRAVVVFPWLVVRRNPA